MNVVFSHDKDYITKYLGNFPDICRDMQSF
jgi:hypothetical protein